MGRRKYTDEQLASAVASARNMREVLKCLGLAPCGGNYEPVKRRIRLLGLDFSHFPSYQKGRGLADCPDDELVDAVRGSRSLSEVLVRLGIRPGGNQSRLNKRIERAGIDTSHFIGQAWRRGSTKPTVPARPLSAVLLIGKSINTTNLRIRLIKAGVKEPRCEMCRRDEWNGEPIPLELDHVNGRRDDNRLSNLRILCPNCHAQTSTYRGRNIGTLDRVS